MFDIIIYLIAFAITIPILATWLIYFITMKLHKRKWLAIHTAVNWTTILYILAVNVLISTIFSYQFFGWLIIVLMGIFSAVIVLQWKLKTEIIFQKAFKAFWRFCFLLFSFLYICLVVVGLIQYIISV